MEREVAVGAAAVSTFKIGRKFVERSLRILSYTTVLTNWLITEIIDPVLRMKYVLKRVKIQISWVFLNKRAVC
ncbi:hypothetical protein SRABI133_02827 [Peribacillus simplex]|uniref:Uncharacterized protein n=1 Tax=Peribacillus simplex TaxID=1478 RepID=A0A9W4KXT1_9BACI|nr:hypothetical protein SRABI133_02827 [Peribacillus simplex]